MAELTKDEQVREMKALNAWAWKKEGEAIGRMGGPRAAQEAWLERAALAKDAVAAVWFGAMPESNGKANWTAILHRGDLSCGFTIERSEHHDRVRYEADRVRHLIGELADEPDILAYDSDMRWPDGWTHPCGVQGDAS